MLYERKKAAQNELQKTGTIEIMSLSDDGASTGRWGSVVVGSGVTGAIGVDAHQVQASSRSNKFAIHSAWSDLLPRLQKPTS